MSADQMTYFTLEIFTEARVLGKDSTDIRELNNIPPTASSMIKLYDNYQCSTPRTSNLICRCSEAPFCHSGAIKSWGRTECLCSPVQQNKPLPIPVQKQIYLYDNWLQNLDFWGGFRDRFNRTREIRYFQAAFALFDLLVTFPTILVRQRHTNKEMRQVLGHTQST